ncbi:MAG TPA: SDR family NAD(P)-dependent oxidoreductase [Spirochaetia bacterium]|nr:SDR family NAD(P)-dependent oxidoreductase [Spirochaetia bacterium]
MNTSVENARRAVLVTGTSSGIGLASAIRLAESGFAVFASVRKEQDRRRLEELKIPGLSVICPLDMNRLDQIEAAAANLAEELSRQGLTLHAFVSNAGGGAPAPIELIAPDMMNRELGARITGPIAILQRILPLLRASGGRILWISTPAIIPTPYVASIHACDFAVNCLSRTLDIELARWKIPSVMIRCGGVQTPAGLRTVEEVERLLDSADPDRLALYGSALRSWAAEMAEFDKQRIPAEEVAETVLRAVAAERPKRRYSVGHMARLAALLEALPQPIADRILKRRFA